MIDAPELDGRTLSLILAAALLIATAGGCPSRSHGTLPPLTQLASPDKQAEHDFRAAEQAEKAGEPELAIQRFKAFVSVYPGDPLVPAAKLALGRILVARADYPAARRWLAGLPAHADPAIAERARMYLAVADAKQGSHLSALSMLRPLVGRTVDAGETRLLLFTIAASERAVGDRLAALETYDRILALELPPGDKSSAETAVSELVGELNPELDLGRAYELLPREGSIWPAVAKRLLRERHDRGDLERVQEIADDMRGQGITLNEELLSLVLRAERSSQADPGVIGAILPLSGRGREAGEAAMRGLMLASGLPSDEARPAFTPRVVFRDDAGNPEKALAALEDLATLHRVIAVVGPVSAGSVAAVSERAAELGVPLITLSPVELKAKGESVFRLASTAREEVSALTSHAHERGARTLAVLSPEGPYGDALVALARTGAATAGLTVVGALRYPPSQAHFLKEASAMAAWAPDTILIGDTAANLALLAPALNAAGLFAGSNVTKSGDKRSGPWLIPSVGFDPGLKQTARRALVEAVFAAPFDAEQAGDFRTAYLTQWKSEPNLFSALGYDAFKLLQAGLRTQATTRAALAQALSHVREPQTSGAAHGFDAEHGPSPAVRLVSFDGTSFVPVTP